MTLPSRKTLLGNVLSLAALGWIYGGDLSDALRARSAEVSALTSLPSPVMPAVVLALAAAVTAVVLGALVRGKGEDFKGYRLLPILLVGSLFADLVLAESRVPLSSLDIASMSLQRFQGLAQELTTDQAVPDDPRVLQPLLEQLGRPPYLVKGEPLEGYTLQVRKDCEGPVREAPGVRPGTLLYCVAPERKGAWVTLMGMPAERRFGEPGIVSAGGETRFVLVRPLPPDEEPTEAFRDEAADAGTSSLQP
ncbi:hypothetical protein HPC49_32790 [Pyxidicoccus fallax]|uniref:Uncharacterized protein n=1 Tax=Pyxidicoccus fallax TaxID=394095 RepID=A0A848LV18_9BACT|nr:hypothetical protein [Pyxidicoccus fallax]NMO21313.1 hypothetical protein [Pyxidicoccus fallax]NPC82988.1 hypothetical protein [Pyxidicoccus fallax]